MPWDPVRDLLTMQERLESLFGRTTACWMPAADLSELPDRYVLTVELPGLGREDVHIDIDDQTLTIRGARPALACPNDRYQQLERGQGEFSRAFRFGGPITAGAIKADLQDGVLTVVVPKANEMRRIDLE
jgi:HSP20 family protein